MRLERERYEDQFTCFICLQGLQKTQLLPCCAKPACEACLKEWFQQQHQSPIRMSRRACCPHCRREIVSTGTIPCPLIDTLRDQFGQLALRIEDGAGRKCKTHGDLHKYYCIECDESACSDGIALHGLHKGHRIEMLSKVQGDYKLELQDIQANVKRSKEICTPFDEFIDRQKQEYVNQINEYVAHVERALENDIDALREKYNSSCAQSKRNLDKMVVDFQELASYYSQEVQEAKFIMKAKGWLEQVSDEFKILRDKTEQDNQALRLNNHIEPPSHNFKVNPGLNNIQVLGQNFTVQIGDRFTISYGTGLASFMVSVKGKTKTHHIDISKSLHQDCLDMDDFRGLTEIELSIRPLTYKDAFDALNNNH